MDFERVGGRKAITDASVAALSMSGSQVALAAVAANGDVLWATAAAKRLLVDEATGIEGASLQDLCSEPRELDAMIRKLEGRRVATARTLTVRRGDGSERRLLMNLEPVGGGAGRSYLCYMVDVTAWGEREARLRDLALRDALSGLPNRRMLMGQLRHLLKRRSGSTGFALALVDGDHLKAVNDQFGHQVGDELIRQLGRRLMTACRGSDFVARLGGDEFAVILHGVASTESALALAARLQQRIVDPFRIGKHLVACNVSIGVALLRSGQRVAELIAEADSALADAKTLGRGRCEGGARAPEEHRATTRGQDISATIARHDLVLHFQPIVDLQHRSIAGFEAMVRMRSASGELLAPRDFMPLAEASGRMDKIGRWTIKNACRLLGQWQERLGAARPPFVTCNVPARLLDDERLPGLVERWLQEARVVEGTLWLELTEAMAVRRFAFARLRELAAKGIRLAIDDFGSGFTSLARLEELPVSALKIDGALVRRLEDRAPGPGVIRGVIELAHDLGMRVTAECVETEGQEHALRTLGCDLAQGFRFCPPVAIEAIERILALTPPAHAAERSPEVAATAFEAGVQLAQYRCSGWDRMEGVR